MPPASAAPAQPTVENSCSPLKASRSPFAATNAQYLYDYAGQDPVDNYDLTGTLPELGDAGGGAIGGGVAGSELVDEEVTREEADSTGMVGVGGAPFTSKTLLETSDYHIDVENPNPGMRPGQLHLQTYGANSVKYQFNFETDTFDGLPKSLAKAVSRTKAARAIRTG